MATTDSAPSVRKRSWFRRLLFRLFAVALGLLITFAVTEGICTVYAWFAYGTIDVAAINEMDTGNTYVSEQDQQKANQLKSYYPHPWLGWVRGRGLNAIRSDWKVNNVGLVGPDFPLKRDPEKFTILLVGGSVAQQFGMAGDDQGRFLETILNTKYRFDRSVTVLVGANGAWSQPQQAIILALYADVVDAVVSLDGYNENRSSLAGSTIRIDKPSQIFAYMNPTIEDGPERVAAAYEASQLRAFALDQPWRSVYFATRAVRRALEKKTPRKGGTQLDVMYLLPRDWSAQQAIDYNMDQYKKYLRLMRSTSREFSLKEVHFIQPCPAIGKTLTEEERRVVGNLEYADGYQKMIDSLLSLRQEGVPVESLADCFDNVSETIYGDPIHCAGGSPGYRIMAETMAERLAKAWNIPRREGASATPSSN